MGNLTQQQMERLGKMVAVGDREGYYSTLESAGVAYGALAGGVVTEETLSGRMANAFMAAQAARTGVVIDRSAALSISSDLMRADFEARVIDRSGAEIGYGPIQEYHERVFLEHGLTRDAWTATAPLDVIGDFYSFYGYSSAEEARSAAWNAMLNHGFAGQSTILREMEKFSYPDGQFLLYPDGYPTDPRAGAWYFTVMGLLAGDSRYLAPEWTDYLWPDWLPPDGTHPFDTRCFPAHTRIRTSRTTSTAISALRVGDVVLAFDERVDKGRGALVPRRVTRLYRNTTTEWIRLRWQENGTAREVITTPGHHFLDEFGQFPTIEEMVKEGRATVVLASGELAEVMADRIKFSTETAHLFDRATSVGMIAGNAAFKPVQIDAWQTYNFEVEDLHTYVAEGVRVHNDSGSSGALGTDLSGPALRNIGVDAAVERAAAAQREAAEAAARVKYDYTSSQDSSGSRPPSPVKGSFGPAGGPVYAPGLSTGGSNGNSNHGNNGNNPGNPKASGYHGSNSSGNSNSNSNSSSDSNYVNNGNNPGNPKASGYHGSNSSGNSNSNSNSSSNSNYVNNGNNPGNPKASGYHGGNSNSNSNKNSSNSTSNSNKSTGNNKNVQPVLLDLDGNGIEIRGRDNSTTFVDSDGDGLLHRTAWADSGDGVLFFDAGNDGLIREQREYVFTEWDPTAKDDMAALRSKFDSNGDGKLTSADAAWANFKVMVTNADGTQTAKTLSELGITEINLLTNTVQQKFDDGSAITGQTTFVMGGVSMTAAAVTLIADAEGHLVEKTVNGATTTYVTRDTSGKVLSSITQTQSVSGNTLTTTNSYDDNGDGSVDRVQTIARTTVGSTGEITEAVSNYKGAAVLPDALQNATVTIRSADGTSVRINRDTSGGGWFNEVESRQIASGILTVRHWEVNKSDSTIATVDPTRWTALTVETVSADGKVRTIKIDSDGLTNGAAAGADVIDGYVDAIETHTINDSLAGTRVETVTTKNANNSTRDTWTLTTTNSGLTNVLTEDRNGDGVVDRRTQKTLTKNGDGSSVALEKSYADASNDALLHSAIETTTSADALTTTTRIDMNGDGAGLSGWDRTIVDATVNNADGSRAQTITVLNGDGSLQSKQFESLGADQLTQNVWVDLDRNGSFETSNLVKSVTVAGTGATQVVTASTWTRNMDGSVNASSVSTTTNQGLTKSTNVALDASGAAVDMVVKNTVTTVGAGASAKYVEFTDVQNSDGTSRTSKEVITSSDGLTVTTYVDRDHHTYGGSAPSYDTKIEEKVTLSTAVLPKDWNYTQTTKAWALGAQYDATGTILTEGATTLLSEQTTQISRDRLRTKVTLDQNGDGRTDYVKDDSTADNGTRTITETAYAYDGSLISSGVSSVSANGLTIKTTLDADGQIGLETVTYDTTVINVDGSRTRSVVIRDADGTGAAIRTQTLVKTSDDGLTVTTSRDLNGFANLVNVTGFERTEKVEKTFGADGTETTLATLKSQGGQLLNAVKTVLSLDGQTVTVSKDTDGNGTFDLVTTSSRLLQANGTSIATTTNATATGAVLSVEKVTSSDDARHVTTQRYLYGANLLAETVQRDVAANGVVTTTDTVTTGAGGLLSKTAVVQLADGSQVTTSGDANGDGIFERVMVNQRIYAADGSTIQLEANQLSNGVTYARKSSITSDDGSVTRATQDANGDGLIDAQEVTTTAISAAGVKTVTVEHFAGGTFNVSGAQGNGATLVDRMVRTISADGRTDTTSLDQDGNGTADRTTVLQVGTDGSKTSTTTLLSKSGTAVATDVTWTNAWGTASVQTVDRNNDGRPDHVVRASVKVDAFGTSDKIVEHVNDRDALMARQQTIVSDDGLIASVILDVDGDGVLDSRTEVLTAYETDGDVVTVRETFDEASTRVSLQTSVVTGNGMRQLDTADYDGDGNLDRITTVQRAADGSWSSQSQLFGQGARLWRETRETQSFDGRDHLIEVDQNGDGSFDTRAHAIIDASSRATSTEFEDLALDGSTKKSILQVQSANGMTTSYALDFNGDGIVDLNRQIDISFNDAAADDFQGGRVERFREYYATGGVAFVSNRSTSADGLRSLNTLDINGDGKIDGQSLSVTSLNADGSKRLVETSHYTSYNAVGNLVVGNLRQRHEVFTSSDGRTITSKDDLDGNGISDKTSVTVVGADGSRTTTESAFDKGGMRGLTFVTTSSADGLITTIARQGVVQTITRSAVDNGTYSWDDGVTAAGALTHSRTLHEVDGLGNESWTVIDQTTSGTTTKVVRVDQAEKQLILIEAAKIYDTVLDRDLDTSESEVLARYVTDGQLDRDALVANLLNSNEFTVRYKIFNGTAYTMSNAAFISQLYLNAFARSPSMEEANAALRMLSGGMTQAKFALMLSDSVEHGVVGNSHLSTNNFDVIMNPVKFERSFDKVYVDELIRGLVDAFYDREAQTAEAVAFSRLLLNGTTTAAQIVDLLFATDSDINGDKSNSLFSRQANTSLLVYQGYKNALGHEPSAEESALWIDNINSGRVSKSDFVVFLAQSLEHKSSVNLHNAVVAGTWTLVQDTVAGRNWTLTGTTKSDSIIGNDGNDTISGGSGADLIFGGTGNDILDGGQGSDVYSWNPGEGNDIISETGTFLYETDVLKLLGVNSSSATFTRIINTNNLQLTLTTNVGGINRTEVITINGEFAGESGANGIERFDFADKSISREDLIDGSNGVSQVALYGAGTGSADRDFMIGSSAAEVLAGGAGNDTLTGNGGADTLRGDSGEDAYIWSRSAGADLIDDSGALVTEVDRLILSDVLSTDASISRSGASNDLLVTVGGTGGAVLTIKDRLIGPTSGKGIELIQFSDGVTWSLDEILQRMTSTTTTGTALPQKMTGTAAAETLLGGASDDTISGGAGAVDDNLKGGGGSDTYIWAPALGNDVIDDTSILRSETDTLDLSDVLGVLSTDHTLKLTRTSASNDLAITAGGAILTVVGQFTDPTKGVGIESILFKDGVTWTLDDIISRTTWTGTTGADTISGASFDDNVYGGEGTDSLSGGAGDDDLYGGKLNDSLVGGDGSDRYLWNTGDGSDTINDTGTGVFDVDSLVMGVASSSVALSKSGNNLVVSLTDGSGAVLTVADRFTSNGTGIELIKFTDGVSVKVLDSPVATVTTAGTAGNDNLTGWIFRDSMVGSDGNDTLSAVGGDDTLVGGKGLDSLVGGAGNDVYKWSVGDGADNINDTVAGRIETDTLLLSDVNSTGVTLSRAVTGVDLLVNIGGTVLKVIGQYSATANSGIEAITFADGVTWQYDDLLDLTSAKLNKSGTLNGTIFRDRLLGNGGADTIYGGAGNDTLIGYGSSDMLHGGEGSDTYIWRHDAGNAAVHAGADTIADMGTSLTEADLLDMSDGVASEDVVLTRVSGSTDLKIKDLYTGITLTVQGQFTAPTSGIGIEALRFNDNVIWSLDDILDRTVVGDAALATAQTLQGTGFRDRLVGGSAVDTLVGAAGDDTLTGGGGADMLYGDDSVTGGSGNDTYIWQVGNGNDTIVDNSHVAANVDTLVLSGVQSSAVSLYRPVGSTDLMVRVNSTVPGGYEEIRLSQQFANASFNDGIERIIFADTTWTQNDIFAAAESWAALGGAGNDSLLGSDFNDNLFSGIGADTLYGGFGDDRLEGGSGADQFFGGSGTDLVRYSKSSQAVNLDLALTTQVGLGDENGDILGDVEGVEGSAYGDTLSGNNSPNIFYGMAGDDTIKSLNGYDSVFGGSGNDFIEAGGAGGGIFDGGDGLDTISYGTAVKEVIVVLSTAALHTGQARSDILYGIENIAGSYYSDQLTGSDRSATESGANLITGNYGWDTIFGRSGEDTLNGGNGNDVIYGGEDNDSLLGEVGDDLLSGEEGADALYGGDGHDQLFGGAGNDLIYGGKGLDTIDAGFGNDSVYGDDDIDLIYLGDGNDRFFDNGQSGTKGVDTVYGGAGNDTLSGGDGNDFLFGGDNDDVLTGANDNDVLTGGAGNDSLTGGGGADLFVFTTGANGTDTIADFNELNGGPEEGDLLQFLGLQVGTFVYRGASAFTGGSDNSEARFQTGQLLVDANGDGVSDIVINMTGLTSAAQLAATDFVWT